MTGPRLAAMLRRDMVEGAPHIPLPADQARVGGVGARTCNGLTALQVAMLVRADKFVPRESRLIDRAGEPIAMGRLASVGDHVHGLARLVELAGPALTQAAFPVAEAAMTAGRPRDPLPVFVAVPEASRPGVDPHLASRLLPALAARSGVPIDLARSRIFRDGRAGGVAAFAAAVAAIRDGSCDPVLVGGVDSYFDPDALEALDAQRRLHSLAAENGFVPGEGAAFLLLGSGLGLRSVSRGARLLTVATASEPHPWPSETPCRADGITEAARGAVAALGDGSHRVPWVLTDVVNERHRVDEWAFAAARIAPALRLDHEHEQPLLSTGDLGAASAAVLSALVATRWATASDLGDVALLGLHSDGPLRGAMLWAAPEAR